MAATEEIEKEILAEMAANPVPYAAGQVNDVITIDGETRMISVPASEIFFGVESDKDVERKHFRCPKVVGDGIDLSKHQIYISYITSDSAGKTFSGNAGLYLCEDVATDGDDITFSWQLSGNVFASAGFIAFKVLAAKTDGENVQTRWNTVPAIGTVLMTVPDGMDIGEAYPDIVTQLLERMASVEKIATEEAMQGYVNTYLEAHPGEIDETLTDPKKAAPANVVGELKEDINVLGLEKFVKTSLKCDYLENAPTTNVNSDYVYTLGDKARIFRNVKKLKLSILSNGGTGTIFLYRPDSIYTQILVFKKSYVLTAGKNEIEIDISESMFDSSPSEGHDYISIAIYSNDSGAFTSQSGQLYLYPNGEPFTWYGNFSDFNVEINNFIPPQTYWDGNLTINKEYPCIDAYMEEKIPKYKSGIIHVSKDGTGDYSTIMDAVRNAGDIDSPTTIVLQEGVYDEIVYLGNKHNISIIGVNRDQCIIKNTTGVYANTPVMVTGNFELRNLTIRMEEQGFYPNYTDNTWATYPGYALHIDGNSRDVNEKTIGRVVNCTLYSEAFPAVGMGVNQNQKIIFENCEMIRNCNKDYFKRDNWKGAILCHSSNYPDAPNQNLMMKDCVLISNYGKSGQIRGNLGDSKSFEITMINNTCFSATDGLNSFEYIKGESTLNGMSHGNTSLNLNAS